MLHETSTWLLAALVVMAASVFRYAVATLYGMKRKVVYPLLRVSLREGGYALVMIHHPAPTEQSA